MIGIIVQAMPHRALAVALLVLAFSLRTQQPVRSDSKPHGAIEGVIVLASDLPRPQPQLVTNTTDPEVCGRTQPLNDLLISEGGGVAHVIVSLSDALPEEAGAPSAPRRVVLDNRDCRFDPRSIVLQAGDTLEMRNSDATLHTVHWYGPDHGNVALPMKGMQVKQALSAEGIYQIKCDVHGWMQAFVRVDPHRYHAVSDATGGFTIEGVPVGAYTLEAWHERLGFLHERVEVEAGTRASFRLAYSSPVP